MVASDRVASVEELQALVAAVLVGMALYEGQFTLREAQEVV
ncbi:hypothetical protein ACFQS5_18980 [Salinirubellus sp. GCM10025899]